MSHWVLSPCHQNVKAELYQYAIYATLTMMHFTLSNLCCLHLNIMLHIISVYGLVKEKLGKPTRVITAEYPYGLPSRSPLCTDVDVMLLCSTLPASHHSNVPYHLGIAPSIAHQGEG